MPFDASSIRAPFRMQPGLRRMAADRPQLHANEPDGAHLQAKLAVLSAHADEALCAVPQWDARPALAALCTQARTDLPQAWAPGPSGGWQARRLGWSVDDAGEVCGDGPPAIGDCLRALPPAWRLPGLLSLAVVEDLAVLDGATAEVPWLAVCLPSHWVPRDKVGRHFAQVHAPVADNTLLVNAAASLARLVSGPQRWERDVWTLTPQPGLDAHPARHPAPPWPAGASSDELAALASLRTEHQTFIPLVEQAQAVFTIEVEVRPLTALAAEPDTCGALADALATMSEAVLAYRSLTPARDRLVDWLRRHAAARPAP